MAKELGLWVVAEGVETEAQLAYLHTRKVEFAQGWLFSRPLPRDEFVVFHHKRQQRYGAAREHMQNPRSVPIDPEYANSLRIDGVSPEDAAEQARI